MTPIDVLWLFGWFFVGLIVFQIRMFRSYWRLLDDVKTAYSLIPFTISFLYKSYIGQNAVMALSKTVVLNIFMGVLSGLIYLIGANISRYSKFGRISYNVIGYFFLFILLLIIYRGITLS